MRTGIHFARKRSDPSSPVHASAPRIGFQIPSARKPAQTTIKLTTTTARKLEEAKSSRMTTPVPRSGRSLVSLSLDAESLGQIAFARLLINQVDDDVPHGHTPVWRETIRPSVRFRVYSSDWENDFIGAACRYIPDPHEASSRNREAGGYTDRPR
jgi:hypothetical protein